MTRTRSCALPPLLALAILAAAPGRADEPPAPPEKTPPDVPAPSEPPPAPERNGSEPAPAPPESPEAPGAPGSQPDEAAPARGSWVDVGHSFVEQRLFAPILRLDRFFSDEREIEAERSTSFLRWRSEVRLREDASRPAFTTGVLATLRLPGLNKQLRRLRLVIAGETRDAVDALFPKVPTGPATPAEPTAEEEAIGKGDAGLRLYLWDGLLAHADLGGGFLLELPPGVYGRLRLRWAIPSRTLFLTRLALIGFWRSDVKFGTTASVQLERPVVRSAFLRLAVEGTLSERSNGVEWGSELALLAPLPPRSGAQIGIRVSGATDAEVIAPDPGTGLPRAWSVPSPDRTRVYARLRRDVYRSWLFVEVEPEIAWPWTPERGRYAAWGLTLRVEVQFHGKEAPPSAPALPPRPEPKDPE